jgi:hypothetical protein
MWIGRKEFDYLVKFDTLNYDDKYYSSPEIALLSALMCQKHNKTWDGKEWVSK